MERKSEQWEQEMVRFAEALSISSDIREVRRALKSRALLELKTHSKAGLPYGRTNAEVKTGLYREGIALQLTLKTAKLIYEPESPRDYRELHDLLTEALAKATMAQVLCMSMIKEGERCPPQLVELPRDYFFRWYTALNRAALFTIGTTLIRERLFVSNSWVSNAKRYSDRKLEYLNAHTP